MPGPVSNSRSSGRATAHLHYFDICGGVVATALAARIVVVAVDPAWDWSPTRVLAVAAFAVTLIGLVGFRSRAYRQDTSWLAVSFSLAAALATIILFWPLHVVWFAGAIGAVGFTLVFALVMRSRPWSEAVSRHDAFKVAAVVIGIALAIAAVEAVLRIAPWILGPELRQMVSVDPAQYGVPHPYIGYLHRPNGATTIIGKDFQAVHKVDAKGFRNPSPWPAKADIVVVGDSVTFGYGVAGGEAWPAVVADTLQGNPLVNLALIGAGPQQYLRVYETFGVDLRPRLLIVGVFAGNDFWDAETFGQWLKSGVGGNFIVWRDFGRPVPVTVSLWHPADSLQGLFIQYVYPVLRTSRIYNLLRAFHGGQDAGSAGPPTYFSFPDGTRLRLFPGDFRSKSAMGERNSPAFRLALDAFERIHTLAAENGTHVLMVLQPSKEEVYLPLLNANVMDPTRSLREAFEERGIEYLDLAPGFRARAAAGERLFFEVDGHPNPKGHALTAELLLSHLARAGHRYGFERPLGVVTTPGQPAPALGSVSPSNH